MTREEFIDDITTMWELLDFCEEHGCYVCEDVYSDEAYNDFINEDIVEWARNETWENLLSILQDLPTGYDYYRRDEYGDWYGVDSYDFDSYKNDVLSWGDDNCEWDEPEEEEGEEETFEADNEDECVSEQEPFLLTELLSECYKSHSAIKTDGQEMFADEEEDVLEDIAELLCS